MKQPLSTIAAEVATQKRKVTTLREQMETLRAAQALDSKKLDALTEKVAHVIEILSAIGPHLEKLPDPPKIS